MDRLHRPKNPDYHAWPFMSRSTAARIERPSDGFRRILYAAQGDQVEEDGSVSEAITSRGLAQEFTDESFIPAVVDLSRRT